MRIFTLSSQKFFNRRAILNLSSYQQKGRCLLRKYAAILTVAALMATLLCGCSRPATPGKTEYTGTKISLSDNGITVDGEKATADPNRPVYVANDIVYYEEGHDHTYGEGTAADAHSKEAADAHTVVHITKPGQYLLSGKLSKGQIAVDLGENAKDDPNAVVTLVLMGADITCDVAPGIIFYSVYECGNKDQASADVDTTKAGANILIADGTENTVNGAYVAKIYKPGTLQLSEDGKEVLDAKKLHKYDGAVYSKMSLNIQGGQNSSGTLNINAANEGLDSELHLTVLGGNINIRSGNDGINTNEDGISVTTIRGGKLDILVTGATGEGDGIDSNGWLVIQGGTVIAQGCATSGDAGIDSDMGIHIHGGTVIASGNMLDRISESQQNYVVFQFSQSGKGNYTLKDSQGNAVIRQEIQNSFTYLVISDPSLTPGDYTLWQDDTQLQGMAGSEIGGPGGRPGGMEPPQGEQPPEGQMPPQGQTPPQKTGR